MAVIGPDRKLRSANRAFRDLFGLRPDQAAAARLEEIFRLDELAGIAEEVIRSGKARHELCVPGGARESTVALIPMRAWDDFSEELIVVAEPAAKRAAARAAAPEGLEQVARKAAHDCNNVVLIISGYAEELLESLAPGDPRQGDVREILRAAGRLTELARALRESAAGEAPAAVPESPPAVKTILVAEDEDGIRQLIKRILARNGYAVVEAAGGDEALARAASHSGPLDAVVTDLRMPGLTGRELIEALRNTRPELRALLISGYTDDPFLSSGQLPPRSAFLAKPFTPPQLLESLKRLLES